MKTNFNYENVPSAILKNDFWPGGDESGLFMKNGKKINSIENIPENILKAINTDQELLFCYDPSLRKMQGDSIVMTDKGMYFLDNVNGEISFYDYDDIYRFSKELFNINIQTYQKIFDLNINDLSLCNFIYYIMKDLYLDCTN